jgi:hypothetical protein
MIRSYLTGGKSTVAIGTLHATSGAISFGSIHQFETTTTVAEVVRLQDNEFIAISKRDSDSHYYAFYCTVSGSTITAATGVDLGTTPFLKACRLTDTLAVASAVYSNYYAVIAMQISAGTLSAGSLVTDTNPINIQALSYPVRTSDTTFAVFAQGTTNYILKVGKWSLSGTTINAVTSSSLDGGTASKQSLPTDAKPFLNSSGKIVLAVRHYTTGPSTESWIAYFLSNGGSTVDYSHEYTLTGAASTLITLTSTDGYSSLLYTESGLSYLVKFMDEGSRKMSSYSLGFAAESAYVDLSSEKFCISYSSMFKGLNDHDQFLDIAKANFSISDSIYLTEKITTSGLSTGMEYFVSDSKTLSTSKNSKYSYPFGTNPIVGRAVSSTVLARF